MGVYFEIANEQWFAIPGFSYEVSDLGRVRGTNHRAGKYGLVATKTDKDGYLFYALCLEGKNYYRKAHRLVAEAFCEKRPFATQVNHKDSVKNNNIAVNLEWVTPSENIRHAVNSGAIKRGAASKRAIFTNEQAAQIREDRVAGLSYSKLAKKHGGNVATHWHIVHGTRY